MCIFRYTSRALGGDTECSLLPAGELQAGPLHICALAIDGPGH